MRRWGLVLILFAASACGGDDPVAVDTTTSTEPTTTIGTDSVEQVASVVARHRNTILELVDGHVNCADSGAEGCIFLDNRYARWGGISDEVGDLRAELANLDEPPELEALVEDTFVVLRAVNDTYSAVDLCFAEHQGGTIDDCATEVDDVEAAIVELPAALDAWQPYL